MSQKRFLLIVAIGVLLAATIPYLAALLPGNNQQFGGFLINPIDGHSYLSKMQEGYRGEWKFTLPYTAEQGQGAFLFLFYLALGHLARVVQLPLLVIFHGARIAGAAVLIWAVSRLTKSIFGSSWNRKIAYFLILIGSGLGWLAVLAGLFTSDFWVAEAFPVLSMYTNPHFSLGLGLIILSILPGGNKPFLDKILLGLGVAVVQPFGVGIVCLVLFGDGLLLFTDEKPDWLNIYKSDKIRGLAGFGLSGGAVLIYQVWAILNDPLLAAWHAQNQTPTPNLTDLMISFSPALILAVLGIRIAWKRPAARKLVIWAGVSMILVFVPWSLQRRFLTGIYVPLAALSVFGLNWLSERIDVEKNFLASVLLILSLPTNIIVVTSGIQAGLTQDQQVFIDPDSLSALNWIKENASQNALVVAEQEMGLYIPSLTGRRVVYGHPFETVSAEKEKGFLASFFYQVHPANYYQQSLRERDVDYVLLSENASSTLRTWLEENWVLVFRAGDREIYQRQAR
ncbi:MAG: hypothetical protein P8Y37_07705 [Anaerolineales bacterium]